MDKLYSVRDICERYQCKAATARKIMRDMEHMESPLMVSERAVMAWERRKTVPPESETRQLIRKGVRG
jgi:hypothetical protein